MGFLLELRSRRAAALATGLVLVLLAHRPAFSQTGSPTATLSGVVTDATGGVMPGVMVVVKHNPTGMTLAAIVTNGAGVFSVPALDPASYTVTVSRQGFRPVVMTDVRVATSTPVSLTVTLEPGAINEMIQVEARSQYVQKQSTTITSTIDSDQIKNLPLNSRNALNFVTFLPGVDTGATHAIGNSTIAGLPGMSLAINIDGVNTQDNFFKGPAFLSSQIIPSLEAVDQATVTLAAPGADASGQGAVQIRFTTRSGTERYAGSFFETWRDPVLNANTFFNQVAGLPVSRNISNQYGGNVGGPIVIPGLAGRGRAFFFTNYEEFRQPSENPRSRTILTPSARAGILTYTGSGATQRINVLNVATANGQIGAIDPVIGTLLGQIAAATEAGSVTANNDNTNVFKWNSPNDLTRHLFTAREDVSATPRHRLSVVYNYQTSVTDPGPTTEPQFPGLPNHGNITLHRQSLSTTFRSLLGSNMVNEATYGVQLAPEKYFTDVTAAQFANQGGYSLFLNGGSTLSAVSAATAGGANPLVTNGSGNIRRWLDSPVWSLTDKLSSQHGRHGVQLGAEFTTVKERDKYHQVVPALTFGVDPADPADAMFTTANFPGASTANLNDARFLYALLTGRVTQVQNLLALDAATGQYVVNAGGDERSRMRELGLFAQDTFRLRRNLTLNLGVRYELQFPFTPLNSLWSTSTIADACGISGLGHAIGGRPCSFFQPGVLAGKIPTYERYAAGTNAYDVDTNNVAPSLGVAWQPGIETGLLRALLGDPADATIRAGFGRAYTREAIGRLAGVFDLNPGVYVVQQRNAANGNLVAPGETSPVLLSQPGRLGPGAFALTPTYPMPIDRGSGINIFDPNWQVSYADSFSVGVQRAFSKNTVVEARYVGTRGRYLREAENWNEIDIVSNGFLDEFKRAQANLQASIAGGCGSTSNPCSFAYRGPDTGTVPLPVFLAYFNGAPASQANDRSKYAGANWTNSTFTGFLSQISPSPFGFASVNANNGLVGNASFRANALAGGLPANYFVLNPDVTSVSVQTSSPASRSLYDSVQLILRRRLSEGLAFDLNYTYAKRMISRFDSLRAERSLILAANGVPQALKMTASYDLPIGEGRRFGSSATGWREAVAGGWSVGLTGRVQSGQILDFGNVRLNGMSLNELQRAIHYRIDTSGGTTRVFNLPQDIIDNTIKAFSFNATGYTAGAPAGRFFSPANGPDCIQIVRGDCAPKDLFVVAPPFTMFDFALRKRVGTGGRTSADIEVDVVNVFNAINFNPTGLPNTNNIASLDAYRVTTSYTDPGPRTGQIVLRFQW